MALDTILLLLSLSLPCILAADNFARVLAPESKIGNLILLHIKVPWDEYEYTCDYHGYQPVVLSPLETAAAWSAVNAAADQTAWVKGTVDEGRENLFEESAYLHCHLSPEGNKITNIVHQQSEENNPDTLRQPLCFDDSDLIRLDDVGPSIAK